MKLPYNQWCKYIFGKGLILSSLLLSHCPGDAHHCIYPCPKPRIAGSKEQIFLNLPKVPVGGMKEMQCSWIQCDGYLLMMASTMTWMGLLSVSRWMISHVLRVISACDQYINIISPLARTRFQIWHPGRATVLSTTLPKEGSHSCLWVSHMYTFPSQGM